MADLAHGAEVDARGGETERGAVEGEVVEEAVGGGVGALAPVACHAADGGKEDEEVEGLWEEGVMEVPGALVFGSDDGVPVGVGGVFEEDVLGCVWC